jgi:hemolysin activation/secretion protein
MNTTSKYLIFLNPVFNLNNTKGANNMERIKPILPCVVFLITILLHTYTFAQPPASQTVGGMTQQEEEIKKGRELEKKIKTERPKPGEVLPEEIIPQDLGPKVLVRRITVEGVTLLSKQEIKNITSMFEGKELSLKAMQKVADLITDEYRKKGYTTSRAFIPPQTIRDGLLIVRVVEGKLGNLEIKGNRYFKTSLLEKNIGIKPAGYFDYSALQRSLVYINEHPDRTAKAILVPGREPGTTDIIIEVEDVFPFHVGFEYDNYGSRYIEENRYSLVLEHNNLLGFDDKLYFKLQYAEASRLRLKQGRYIFPLDPSLDLGLYFLRSTLKLGHEFLDFDARGKATIVGLFLNKALVTEEDIDLRLSLGFDYKDIKNYLFDALDTRDEVRLLKCGLDLDVNDNWGRTILTSQLDIGIPNIMGGMPDRDPQASRAGAAGEFYKGVFNLFRLQPGPWASSILWKNSAQYTN